jgi:DNA-binding transcriptional LysR family regulator
MMEQSGGLMRRLEMLVALDAHRSFNRAARSLGISQPALTRALQTLENEVGARLFERGKTDCTPTEFGTVMLARGRRIIAEMAEARREIAMLQGLEIGEFRIGAASFVTQLWLGAAIGQLSAAHPRLKIRSMEHLWYQLAGALMAAEIDVAIGEASELVGNPEIVVGRLPRRLGAFVCRAGHPLAGKARVGIADLADFPLAAPRLPRRIASHLPPKSALGGMAPDSLSFHPSILCETVVGIADLVENSDALGVVPRVSLGHVRQRAGVVALPFEAPWLCTEQALMWRRDRLAHPALKAFRDAARRCEAAIMGKPALSAVA